MLKMFGFIFILLIFSFASKAQEPGCTFKPSQFTIHFGTGIVEDPNSDYLANYRRVISSCPSDGFYSFSSYTFSCFHDDWHTLTEDHTPGDEGGNMLLVNAARHPGPFLRTAVSGLKSNTTYEIGFWLMNLCKPTKKCPTVLLPNLSIHLETTQGIVFAKFFTGDLPRLQTPMWTRHRAVFTTPASSSTLMLVMIDNVPSGCGNDFVLDDITFRECEQPVTQPSAPPGNGSAPSKSPTKMVKTPSQKRATEAQPIKSKADTSSKTSPILKESRRMIPPAPLVLKNRENALVKKIETEAGEIKIDIYDNGQIDGDSVSVYHNNRLIRSHMRLSRNPISIIITINPADAHHEIIMVAENLGTIPPNTSVMVVTTPGGRYELFISSSEQKNAKVIFDLKK